MARVEFRLVRDPELFPPDFRADGAYATVLKKAGQNAGRGPLPQRRVQVLRDAGRQLRTSNPEKTGAGRA